jgi:hypothetical protein
MQIDVERTKRSLAREARAYAFVFLYLYICIGTLSVYKSLILREYGIEYFPLGFALLKALVLAKFILTGHMLRIGETFDHKPLIYSTLYKGFIFFLLLLALSAAEEAIKGMLRGKTFFESLLDIGGGTFPGLLAYCVIGLLFLLPYIALRQLNDVLGAGRLFDLFFRSTASLDMQRSIRKADASS